MNAHDAVATTYATGEQLVRTSLLIVGALFPLVDSPENIPIFLSLTQAVGLNPSDSGLAVRENMKRPTCGMSTADTHITLKQRFAVASDSNVIDPNNWHPMYQAVSKANPFVVK